MKKMIIFIVGVVCTYFLMGFTASAFDSHMMNLVVLGGGFGGTLLGLNFL